MFMLLLLWPTTKIGYHDVTMHALYFLWRERGGMFRWWFPTCGEKRGKGKGKRTIGPWKMDLQSCVHFGTQTFVSVRLYPVHHIKSYFLNLFCISFHYFSCLTYHRFARPFFILGPMVRFPFPLSYFLSQVGRSCLKVLPLSLDKKYSACMVMSRWHSFVVGRSKKKA